MATNTEKELGSIRERLAVLEVPKPPNTSANVLSGIVATTLLGFLAWLGITVVDQGKRISSLEAKSEELRRSLETKLEDLSHRLDSFNAALLAAELRSASNSSNNPENIRQAQVTFKRALANRIVIDAASTEAVGKKFIDAAKNNPAAWDVVLAALDYKSFLNEKAAPPTENAKSIGSLPKTTEAGWGVSWRARALEGFSEKQLSVMWMGDGRVPADEGGQFREIGKLTRSPAPKWIVIEATGFEISVDGYHIRNAVIRNAKIRYTGGPLVLENVYFVNCTFEVSNTPASEKLGAVLLASASITYSTVGL